MNEMEFSQKIDDLGGTLYIVGGWVRDKIRGVIPKDKDFVICHVKEEDFKQNFPKAKKVGKSFPVYLVKIEDKECEVAFVRKERKTGIGYTPLERLPARLHWRQSSLHLLQQRALRLAALQRLPALRLHRYGNFSLPSPGRPTLRPYRSSYPRLQQRRY